jgi:hypothetical protein
MVKDKPQKYRMIGHDKYSKQTKTNIIQEDQDAKSTSKKIKTKTKKAKTQITQVFIE